MEILDILSLFVGIACLIGGYLSGEKKQYFWSTGFFILALLNFYFAFS